MKKLLLMVSMVALIIVLGGCKEKKEKEAPALVHIQQTDSLSRIIAQKNTEMNDMMGTLNEIQNGFKDINEAENRVDLVKDGEGADKSEQLRENIQFISNRMKQNRSLIAKLRQQLRESSFKSDQFKKTIDNLIKELNEKDQQLQELRVELDAKNIHISELDETINTLNSNVNNLTSESAQKTETISAQDKQLNTAWYVFGTKAELKEQGIIQGNRVMQGNYNKNYFTKVDIRVDKEIKLYSKVARLLTIHPSSSYTLTKDGSNQYVLRITNPQIFWSTSKYLVILVK
jgi:chromosome segregation ATPase